MPAVTQTYKTGKKTRLTCNKSYFGQLKGKSKIPRTCKKKIILRPLREVMNYVSHDIYHAILRGNSSQETYRLH